MCGPDVVPCFIYKGDLEFQTRKKKKRKENQDNLYLYYYSCISDSVFTFDAILKKCSLDADAKNMTIHFTIALKYPLYFVHVNCVKSVSGWKRYEWDFNLPFVLVPQWVPVTTRTIRRRPCHSCTIAFLKGARLWTFWEIKRSVTVLVRLKPKCWRCPIHLTWNSLVSLSFFSSGKAHLRRAIQGHEEALRIYGLCHHLNKLEALQDILKASLKRSFDKYSENEKEDEFTDYMEAPDIIRELFSKTCPANTKHVFQSQLVTRCLGHFMYQITFHNQPKRKHNLRKWT